ncbi:uncharacterized protein N7515_004598 [Penicillium bovifimosum]|uniref:ADP-ribosylation factor n=1 Tax=Penicillium bovifimosum TaxID=126998 RepID=A0A9W9H0R5_9EURO|nr:uncharacterized protein N7515_004598 [Penicillium bovifimosum]KAJ5135320.1 hypothetical protein N7515_004598 [Penicillium bovifimosum]
MSETITSRDSTMAQDYYASLDEDGSLVKKFKDIDDETQFHIAIRRLQDPLTQNFVLDFGNEDAWCASDLTTYEMKSLLRKPRAKCLGTRWINIWAPEEQKESIKVRIFPPSKRSSRSSSVAPSFHHDVDDPENALKQLSDLDRPGESASFKNLTFAQIVDQIWHFSSVDHGPRYTCIGYNTLFVIPTLSQPNGKDLPDGKRLWTWLIQCDDGTVISIQENPFAGRRDGVSMEEAKPVLDIVRRNMRFIFSGVSRQHYAMSESESLITIRVRHFNDFGPDQANIKQEDGPSLLFYYIFDDWVSSYGLIAKREHKYGVALEELRGQMLDRPIVDLVNELHWLGRRLAVLKRLYQSYELIMQRLLQRQRMLRDEARSAHPATIPDGATYGDAEFVDIRQSSLVGNSSHPNTEKSVGVQLSSSAVARFERLADRINLYCLSEIENCLNEKESLTFLNFNLIALKDSQAVEKLTRITILLAKATILFLPVSLMSAYFSTELIGVKNGYTKTDYWVSFAVIFVLSVLLLTVFGYASDTVEGKTIYRSMVRTFFRESRQKISRRR